MKKTKTILFCALLTFVGRAAAQSLSMSAENVVIDAGSTAELNVSLENPMDVAGWQLYLYLPEGIDIAFEEEDGERYYTVALSSRHLRSHTCTVTPTADGGYLIMGYNPSKPTNIKGHSGELIAITLQAADSFCGVYEGTIRKAAVSDLYFVQTNIDDDITFYISDTATGISDVTTDGDDVDVYRVDGRHAKATDKGLLVKKGRKHVAK